MATLVTQQILLEIVKSFAKRLPMLTRMGTDFRAGAIVKNKTYTAHIGTLPTIADVDPTTGYVNGAQEASGLLTDLDIKVENHKHVPIKLSHLTVIQQDQKKYRETIANAGYVLAKAVIDSVLAKINFRSFSQWSTFATADCDFDMLVDVTGDLNGVGALGNMRTMLVNSAAANALSADSRIASKDYAGQLLGGEGYRHFRNVGGFGDIIEYPDLGTNNGTALTSVTGEADDDLLTKTAHGLNTGDRVIITFSSGFTGLTTATAYYAIRAGADTFKLASTYALALAGTGIDITADGTGATVTRTENLVAFGFDPRALALLTGIPADSANLAAELGIPQVVALESVTDPESGITMAAVKWQAPGTQDLYWSPTLLWGSRVGKEPQPAALTTTLAVGAACDYAGHRVVSS